MIIAQISIAPIGKDTSVSKYVKIAINTIKKYDIKFATNAMSTIIETENIETLFKIVTEAHKEVQKSGTDRLITEIKIDDRTDKNATIESKLKSLK